MRNSNCGCNRAGCSFCDRRGQKKPAPCPPAETVLGTADYVLVGLGTAGSPLARLLTDDFATSVIVLEAGENRSADPAVATGGFPGAVPEPDPRYHWFRAIDPAALISRFGREQYTEGRMWGGSSSHNYMTAVRGTQDIYDAWAARSGSAFWSYASLLPLMLYMENYHPNGTVPDLTQRGVGGPVDIVQTPPLDNSGGVYTAMSAALNTPFISDYNDHSTLLENQIGIAQTQIYNQNTFGGPRESAYTAFLQSVVTTDANGDGHGSDGRQLTIFSRAIALEVVIESVDGVLTATGVRFFREGNPDDVFVVRAKKKVILCAGAIASPQLLQLSGIGPASVLQAAGIPVRVENENVGRNLQTHYGPLGIVPLDRLPPFEAGSTYWDGSGANIQQPHDGIRRVQIFNVPFSAFAPPDLAAAVNPNNELHMTFATFLLRPQIQGTAEIVTRDPTVQPYIRPNFYTDQGPYTDLHRAVDTLKAIANISIQLTGRLPLYPLPAWYPAAEYGAYGGQAPDDSQLEFAARSTYLIAFHATGTARMATNPGDGVVDANLNVFGVNALSVCDNSVVPQIEDGNTAYQALVVGLAKAKIEGAPTPF